MAVNVHVIECNVAPSAAPNMVGQHWVALGCVWLSVGTSAVSDWIKVNEGEAVQSVDVPASSTVSLNTIAMADFCAADYEICMSNSTEDKWKSVKFFGSKKTSTTLDDSVYAVLGSILDIDLNFVVSGPNAVLEATNNESFQVTVKFKVETI